MPERRCLKSLNVHYPTLESDHVPMDLLGLAERAVDACPTLALVLEEDPD